MKIAFFSNYFNHHQEYLCNAFYSALGDDFVFVATTPFNQNRAALGYVDMNGKYRYIVTAYGTKESEAKIKHIIRDFDIAIFGSCPEEYVQKWLESSKIAFRYSERILKEKPPLYKYPLRRYRLGRLNPKDKPLYMLCASAYTAHDFNYYGLFYDKCFRWGYFPEFVEYGDVGELIDKKTENSILWVGRLIDWKHPETAIHVAKRLKNDGYSFSLSIIGSGDMQEYVTAQIEKEGLSECVHFLGSMSPKEVRNKMEESELFLFTSDRKEGWGAVLNESMNSACAVVANDEIGSVPFLLEDKVNGEIFHKGSEDECYEKIRYLLEHPAERKEISKKAYATLRDEWNAISAAERFIQLGKDLAAGKESPYMSGPCSKIQKK